MSTVSIKIRTDNAAFGGNMAPEVARILRELANQIEQRDVVETRYLRDVNGNRVGYVTLTGG